MERLLVATAVIEVAAGVALMSIPSSAAMLLMGAPLTTVAALTAARVGGAGLLALGLACWLARGDAGSRAARGLVAAMLLYNAGALAVLGDAGIRSQPVGAALWPEVLLHAAMAGWCVLSLVRQPTRSADLGA